MLGRGLPGRGTGNLVAQRGSRFHLVAALRFELVPLGQEPRQEPAHETQSRKLELSICREPAQVAINTGNLMLQHC